MLLLPLHDHYIAKRIADVVPGQIALLLLRSTGGQTILHKLEDGSRDFFISRSDSQANHL